MSKLESRESKGFPGTREGSLTVHRQDVITETFRMSRTCYQWRHLDQKRRKDCPKAMQKIHHKAGLRASPLSYIHRPPLS